MRGGKTSAGACVLPNESLINAFTFSAHPTMPELLRADSYLCLLDCLSGERVAVEKSPFVIGALPSSDLRLTSPSAPQVLCTIIQEGGGWHVSFADSVLLNGAPCTAFHSMPEEEHSVVGRGCMLAFKNTPKKGGWLNHCVTLLWSVYDTSVHDWVGPFALQQLRGWLVRLAEDARKHLVLVPAGMQEVGFFVKDVQDLLSVGSARERSLEEHAWYRRQMAETNKRAAGS